MQCQTIWQYYNISHLQSSGNGDYYWSLGVYDHPRFPVDYRVGLRILNEKRCRWVELNSPTIGVQAPYKMDCVTSCQWQQSLMWVYLWLRCGHACSPSYPNEGRLPCHREDRSGGNSWWLHSGNWLVGIKRSRVFDSGSSDCAPERTFIHPSWQPVSGFVRPYLFPRLSWCVPGSSLAVPRWFDSDSIGTRIVL